MHHALSSHTPTHTTCTGSAHTSTLACTLTRRWHGSINMHTRACIHPRMCSLTHSLHWTFLRRRSGRITEGNGYETTLPGAQWTRTCVFTYTSDADLLARMRARAQELVLPRAGQLPSQLVTRVEGRGGGGGGRGCGGAGGGGGGADGPGGSGRDACCEVRLKSV